MRTPALIALLTGAVLLAPLTPAPAAPPLERPLAHVSVIAHRGLSYDNPEHTFAAYDGAVLADADMIECDLQLTKDGVLVCIHDTTVDRTTGGKHTGRVDSYTLAQLRAMDFGSWFNTANPTRAKASFAGLRIVPFEEQLRCYRKVNPRLRFHVETKAPSEYGGTMEPQLAKVLKKYGLLGGGDAERSTVVIQSFELDSLKVMAKLAPKLPRAFLFSAPSDAQQAQAVFPSYVTVAAPTAAFLLANPAFTRLAHDRGLAVHTWTVDDPNQMDALISLGVDGIFTNRADVLRERVDASGLGIAKSKRHNPTRLSPGCPGVAGSVHGPASASGR